MLINVLLFIFFWFLGYLTCHAYHKEKKCSGNILLVDQGEGSPVVMLEIFEGHRLDIRQGNIVELYVKEENLTRK